MHHANHLPSPIPAAACGTSRPRATSCPFPPHDVTTQSCVPAAVVYIRDTVCQSRDGMGVWTLTLRSRPSLTHEDYASKGRGGNANGQHHCVLSLSMPAAIGTAVLTSPLC